jgi:hypothetical protein
LLLISVTFVVVAGLEVASYTFRINAVMVVFLVLISLYGQDLSAAGAYCHPVMIK